MNLIQSWYFRRLDQGLHVDRLSANRGAYMRTITGASSEDQQPQIAVGRIEWSSRQSIGVENDTVA